MACPGGGDREFPPFSSYHGIGDSSAGFGGVGPNDEPGSPAGKSKAQPGGVLAEIREGDIEAGPHHLDPYDRFEHIASYNWLERVAPAIVIPGSPPEWHSPAPSEVYLPDHGPFIKDQNADLWPSYPLEPTFRALSAMVPKLKMNNVDLVTCQATLEKLFAFILGRGESYRFDVEIVGNTAIFTRMEEDNILFISDCGSYRSALLTRKIRWPSGLLQSKSHFRIARCSLGKVNCLLRYECHAFIPGKNSKFFQTPLSTPGRSRLPSHTPTFAPGGKNTSGLEIRFGGEEVSVGSTTDVNTHDPDNSEEREKRLIRLWLTQTSNVVEARRTWHNFEDVKEMKPCKEVDDWEDKNLKLIAKLDTLIKMIIKVAKEVPGGKCWVNIAASMGLFVMEPTATMGRMSLPEDIKKTMFKVDGNKEAGTGNISPPQATSSFQAFLDARPTPSPILESLSRMELASRQADKSTQAEPPGATGADDNQSFSSSEEGLSRDRLDAVRAERAERVARETALFLQEELTETSTEETVEEYGARFEKETAEDAAEEAARGTTERSSEQGSAYNTTPRSRTIWEYEEEHHFSMRGFEGSYLADAYYWGDDDYLG